MANAHWVNTKCAMVRITHYSHVPFVTPGRLLAASLWKCTCCGRVRRVAIGHFKCCDRNSCQVATLNDIYGVNMCSGHLRRLNTRTCHVSQVALRDISCWLAAFLVLICAILTGNLHILLRLVAVEHVFVTLPDLVQHGYYWLAIDRLCWFLDIPEIDVTIYFNTIHLGDGRVVLWWFRFGMV